MCMSIMDFYPMRPDCGLNLKLLGKIERRYMLLKPYNEARDRSGAQKINGISLTQGNRMIESNRTGSK